MTGFEPARPFGHESHSLACLPFSPHPPCGADDRIRTCDGVSPPHYKCGAINLYATSAIRALAEIRTRNLYPRKVAHYPLYYKGVAEGRGFEPLCALTQPVFETGAIDRSANLPCGGETGIRTLTTILVVGCWLPTRPLAVRAPLLGAPSRIRTHISTLEGSSTVPCAMEALYPLCWCMNQRCWCLPWDSNPHLLT